MKTFVCLNCGITYQKSATKRPSNHVRKFCSDPCQHEYRRKNSVAIKLFCANCNAEMTRLPKDTKRSKTGLFFCGHSCAAKYGNAHKKQGTRRSKLEEYIEQQLRIDFPHLELICNGRNAIGAELDFYLPQLRLAIELNGIFHYEPIYGTDRLEKTQNTDRQKFAACNAAGIELCVIDTSSVANTTNVVKERYYTIVRDLVIQLLGRAGSANVQAL